MLKKIIQSIRDKRYEIKDKDKETIYIFILVNEGKDYNEDDHKRRINFKNNEAFIRIVFDLDADFLEVIKSDYKEENYKNIMEKMLKFIKKKNLRKK